MRLKDAMRKFDLKVNGNIRSSLSEDEVSELFCEGSITRNTLCRPTGEKNWRTCDELLPALKYGVHRPESKMHSASLHFERNTAGGATITDVHLPCSSVFRLMLQVMTANFIIAAVLTIVGLLFWLVFGAILIATFSNG